jgi:catechol 2,3-dioxygenase-like lactoylglutathione lyase family enzyme
MHIGAATLLVRDYDEAIAWFTGKLGFVVIADNPLAAGERWVTVAPAQAQTWLRLARAQTPLQVARVGHQADERVLFYLYTDDFAREHAAYISRGVRFVEQPRREAYGTVAVFEDLYGNRWDLLHPSSGH